MFPMTVTISNPAQLNAVMAALNVGPNIPELEPHCGSWIVIDRSTGRAVGEFFERKTVERINFEKYQVLTAQQHLASLNKEQQQ